MEKSKPRSASEKAGVDCWGYNSERGRCQCCQHVTLVYRGYTGGQDLPARMCALCKSSTHLGCEV